MINLVAVVLILASLDQAKSETTWDDGDWKMDGVKYVGGTEFVNVVSVHDMALQIKTDNVVGSGDYFEMQYVGSGYLADKLIITFDDPITYQFQRCHAKMDFPTANFPTDVQKIWSVSLTNEPDIVITVDVNGVRVAEMSADLCDKEDWKDNWRNFDFKKAEINVYTSAEDMVDGYKVVVKEDPENDENDNGETENEDNHEDNHNYSGAGYTNISAILFGTLLCTINMIY